MVQLLREYTMICLYCSAIVIGFCGIAIFGYGLIYILQGGIFIEYCHYPYGKYPIVAGVIFVLAGVINFYAAGTSRNTLVGLSTILLVGLVTAQLVLSTKGFEKLLSKELDEDLNEYLLSIYGDNDFHEIEANLKCCGFNGTMDYDNQDEIIPESCCDQENNNCTIENAFQEGCYESYHGKVAANIRTSSGISIGAAILGIISIFASILYMVLIYKERKPNTAAKG